MSNELHPYYPTGPFPPGCGRPSCASVCTSGSVSEVEEILDKDTKNSNDLSSFLRAVGLLPVSHGEGLRQVRICSPHGAQLLNVQVQIRRLVEARFIFFLSKGDLLLRDKMNCTVRFGNCVFRVLLMYIPALMPSALLPRQARGTHEN